MSTAVLTNASPTADSGSSPGSVSDDVANVFVAVAWRVLVGFFLGSLVLMGGVQVVALLGFDQPISADQGLWISIFSGLITVFSLVPGLVIGRNVPVDKVARASVAMVATSSALAIRFAGTVALFVACRYHFGEESMSIVFLVIGWYVFLTSIEVHGLARGLMSMDSATVVQVQKFDRRNS